MRAKQSAIASRRWQKQVRADPASHPVARARAMRDLTEKELGELSGTCAQTVSRAEHNKYPQQPTREKLARALALPESELFP
jgi:transcriptional regulator with XRE-family HTH domain